MNTQTTLLGPTRIQRTRRKGSRLPAGAVCVSRPHRLGNMFKVEALPTPLFDPGQHAVVDTLGQTSLSGPDLVFPDRWAASVVAVRLYELHVGPMGCYEYDDDTSRLLLSLAGRDLACWCPLTDKHGNRWPCHANSILRWANNLPDVDDDDTVLNVNGRNVL